MYVVLNTYLRGIVHKHNNIGLSNDVYYEECWNFYPSRVVKTNESDTIELEQTK